MSLINFKLKHPDEIAVWGTEPHTTMHWFGLTDSTYWLDLKHTIFYEYTESIIKHWGGKESKYVDYQLIRFVEDFTDLFGKIAAPIPNFFYEIAKTQQSLYNFYEKANTWLDNLLNDEVIDINTDKYEQIIEWIYDRSLGSTHLIGAPSIHFFRNGNNISLVWKADNLIEDTIPMWTANNGELEMKFDDFVLEVEDFGKRFFAAMETQVNIAIAKDWQQTSINKSRLVDEQKERQIDFNNKLALLKTGSSTINWGLIESLIDEMNKKIYSK